MIFLGTFLRYKHVRIQFGQTLETGVCPFAYSVRYFEYSLVDDSLVVSASRLGRGKKYNSLFFIGNDDIFSGIGFLFARVQLVLSFLVLRSLNSPLRAVEKHIFDFRKLLQEFFNCSYLPLGQDYFSAQSFLKSP